MLVVDRIVDGSDRVLSLLGDGPARPRAEAAVRSFAHGARLARTHTDVSALVHALADAPGFAWEGAGLVAALDDRFEALLADARPQAPWLYIGLGWADALAGRGAVAPTDDADAAAWLRLDGCGFWLGLRYAARIGEASHRPIDERAAAYFDQGVGRSLYFVHGGTIVGLERAIAARGQRRAAGLWVGVGIATHITGRLDDHAKLVAVGGEPLLRGVAMGEHLISARPPS